jgi:hypothetical protein
VRVRRGIGAFGRAAYVLSVAPRGLTLAYKVAELAPTLVSPTPEEPLVSTAGAAIFAVVKPTSELSIGP